jgi:hypothetical protein
VLGVLVANHAVMRFTSLWRVRPLYLALQTANLVSAGAILWYGLPGFESWPVARFLVAGVFVFRFAMNEFDRANALRDDRPVDPAFERERLRRQIAESDDDEQT